MASVIAVNSDVEAAIAKLGTVNNYDPGTLDIELVNTAGPTTTVRYTGHFDVPTIDLLNIICGAAQQVIAGLSTPTETNSA